VGLPIPNARGEGGKWGNEVRTGKPRDVATIEGRALFITAAADMFTVKASSMHPAWKGGNEREHEKRESDVIHRDRAIWRRAKKSGIYQSSARPRDTCATCVRVLPLLSPPPAPPRRSPSLPENLRFN
jgi:hypothetical protein